MENKKNIKRNLLNEIKCFRNNYQSGETSDWWLVNQIGYIDALCWTLDRIRLRDMFDRLHSEIRDRNN